MSIPVEVARLGEALAGRGSGYLLTCSADGAVKAVTVEPSLVDGVLRCPPSRGSAANLAVNPRATLLFPPSEHHGHTLLVDGTGAVEDEGIVVAPESAVLHRPADHADGPLPGEGCGHDCTPVT
ncbi:pyridoxamine 5'-phosphate oxidase family protein [Nocardioides coralli]|uniref:pyridoxamine 5'-phosphate oxidase family protein n=1 Tax=Nocardioides coralli TaxID=2872154 RepID=UPI001CA4280F|nr:pyridoxamine 5'-phosphate oxidase family protein [Nocardioides coralli]QZY28553.1 pyridoxamine 5'-phosphate oxidase family protein [Nocardioides coralli]